MFLDTPPAAGYHVDAFYQGSRPEQPSAAPTAFVLKGKITTHNDRASINTFPSPSLRAPSVLTESENDGNSPGDEMIPPELDELCAREAGTFSGDGYPRPVPPTSFLDKMAALGVKQALAVAPDVTSAKAALTDIELFLRGPSRGKSGGYTGGPSNSISEHDRRTVFEKK